ncbi:class I SAM-dependent methyltransferase [Patulibacter minatonensis]|uniref:class I SAM-dependent methyltransferase n=1 Tax=Patulibacter minatonensis TaxID=298163 RepID=UPI00047A8968|nr:methyltransferase domain-containing protein [Patulibacter minatonensis]
MIDWGTGTYELTATQLAPAAERAVAAAEIVPGDRVLDVACGTGNAALLAAMRGAQVTGVDQAERLLEVAAGRARAAGVEVDWRAGDAVALPCEDDAFDAALSVFGVIFAPAAPAVAELVRVTAPGGRVVLVTWTREGTVAAGSGILRRAMADTGAIPAAGPGLDPAVVDWGDPEHLAGLFAPHGGEVEVERYGHAFEGASPEAFADEWMERHPMWLSGREALGDEAFAALRDPLVAVLSEGNEDPDAFRATSTALVVHVQLP